MKTMQYFKNVSTLELYPERCAGCKMCNVVCPHAVFEIVDKKARIVDADDCMECGACALNCQYNAIRVRSGVGCAAGILNGIMNNSAASCDCAN